MIIVEVWRISRLRLLDRYSTSSLTAQSPLLPQKLHKYYTELSDNKMAIQVPVFFIKVFNGHHISRLLFIFFSIFILRVLSAQQQINVPTDTPVFIWDTVFLSFSAHCEWNEKAYEVQLNYQDKTRIICCNLLRILPKGKYLQWL